MNESELRLLRALKETVLTAEVISQEADLPLNSVMSLAETLEKQGFVHTARSSAGTAQLSEEGKAYLGKGLPERRLVASLLEMGGEALFDDAAHKANLTEAERQVALPWAKRKGWISISRKGGAIIISLMTTAAESDAELALEQIGPDRVELTRVQANGLAELVQRGLARSSETKSISLRITPKGAEALGGAKDTIGQLTPELLRSGAWKGKTLRSYDLNTVRAPLFPGKRQFYERFLDNIREALVGMGFREVNGGLVETEFWNMDALFMAQDHPARDAHDVFYPKEPTDGTLPSPTLVERVRHMHQEGGLKSKGWRYKWSAEIAKRLVLRSQTTALSAREMARGLKYPARLFSIGRVFRPDEIDWKHMLEFEQCEGIVMDSDLSFRGLVGYLKSFATDVIGAEDARVVPSYYPFTEPSADLVVKVPGKGWTEMGGAGMFRPEMLEALGVDVPVLAWGLGIGRLATIKLGISDIRDLHTTDINLMRSR